MPKNKISEYSSTPGDNTDIGGINIAEGMAPSDVNNAMREQMSQLKEFLDGSSGDTITTAKIVATTAEILSGVNVTGTATFNSAVIMSSSLNVTNTATMGVITSSIISGSANTLTVDGTNAVGFRNIPQSGSAKTTSYTLATGDIGKLIEVGSGGSITVPDATFSVGDVISIFNNTSSAVTITCTITTAYVAGADSDEATVDLATRGICTILFISGTVCVISGNVAP
jgi:hypothetical protein